MAKKNEPASEPELTTAQGQIVVSVQAIDGSVKPA